jgi:hypothetical protein
MQASRLTSGIRSAMTVAGSVAGGWAWNESGSEEPWRQEVDAPVDLT